MIQNFSLETQIYPKSKSNNILGASLESIGQSIKLIDDELTLKLHKFPMTPRDLIINTPILTINDKQIQITKISKNLNENTISFHLKNVSMKVNKGKHSAQITIKDIYGRNKEIYLCTFQIII